MRQALYLSLRPVDMLEAQAAGAHGGSVSATAYSTLMNWQLLFQIPSRGLNSQKGTFSIISNGHEVHVILVVVLLHFSEREVGLP